METFFLPDPRSVIDTANTCKYSSSLRMTKIAKEVLDVALGLKEEVNDNPFKNHEFEIDSCSSLSKNQKIYDNYFKIQRSSKKPVDVLESATIRAVEILQAELNVGTNLSPVEVSSLYSGLATVLTTIETLRVE